MLGVDSRLTLKATDERRLLRQGGRCSRNGTRRRSRQAPHSARHAPERPPSRRRTGPATMRGQGRARDGHGRIWRSCLPPEDSGWVLRSWPEHLFECMAAIQRYKSCSAAEAKTPRKAAEKPHTLVTEASMNIESIFTFNKLSL